MFFVSKQYRRVVLKTVLNIGNEECRPIGVAPRWGLLEPTFRRNMSPPSSRWKGPQSVTFDNMTFLAISAMKTSYRKAQYNSIQHCPPLGQEYWWLWHHTSGLLKLCIASYRKQAAVRIPCSTTNPEWIQDSCPTFNTRVGNRWFSAPVVSRPPVITRSQTSAS
jgi:hypothetical protein